MPQGSKAKYSDKQKRKAEHIEESYEEKGLSEGEAERRAWATVNKQSGGGEKSGSGRKKSESSKAVARSDSAKKAASTRKKKSASTTKKTSTAGKSASTNTGAKKKFARKRSASK